MRSGAAKPALTNCLAEARIMEVAMEVVTGERSGACGWEEEEEEEEEEEVGATEEGATLDGERSDEDEGREERSMESGPIEGDDGNPEWKFRSSARTRA